MTNYKSLLGGITTIILDVDGVLTDSTVQVTTDGELLRTMNIKDGYALAQAVKAGYRVCIISGGKNDGVRKRLEGLGVHEIYMGVGYKLDVLNTFLLEHKIADHEFVYMGDDIPDVPALQRAGVAACPQDAVPEVKAVCNYISHVDGGRGAVRDVIRQVMMVQNKWQVTPVKNAVSSD